MNLMERVHETITEIIKASFILIFFLKAEASKAVSICKRCLFMLKFFVFFFSFSFYFRPLMVSGFFMHIIDKGSKLKSYG